MKTVDLEFLTRRCIFDYHVIHRTEVYGLTKEGLDKAESDWKENIRNRIIKEKQLE